MDQKMYRSLGAQIFEALHSGRKQYNESKRVPKKENRVPAQAETRFFTQTLAANTLRNKFFAPVRST